MYWISVIISTIIAPFWTQQKGLSGPIQGEECLDTVRLAPYSKNNHCSVHECPPLKATMNQFKEVHTLVPCSFQINFNAKTKQSANELYRPSDRHLSAKLVPTIADRGVSRSQRAWSLTAVSGLLDRSRYFFLQVAPQLSSRGWVGPVPDPLLVRKSGSAGNRARTSGSVARKSDHKTTEEVPFQYHLSI
jgi:hypothetical protein